MSQSCKTHASKPGYILVADDDFISRLVVEKILQQADYNVDFVVDGEQAIKALKSKSYSLFITDCFMPQMDGFAAAQYIRGGTCKDIDRNIPIIAMTGLTSKKDRRRCQEAGMDDYITKPVNPKQLITLVEYYLPGSREEQTNSSPSASEQQQIWEEGTLNNMIDGFMAELPNVVLELQLALEQADIIKLRYIGHRLKGVSDVLKVSSLSEQSQALELAGKNGDLNHASNLARQLIEEMQRLSVALED